MKYLLIVLALLVASVTALAQNCQIYTPDPQDPKGPTNPYGQIATYGDIANPGQYAPNTATPVKYVRVDFHFFLKESGTAGYPGNFTETDDGLGHATNPSSGHYDGYDAIDHMLGISDWSLNQAQFTQMNLPIGNNTAKLEVKYNYVVNGVYFHRNNSLYPNTSFLNSLMNNSNIVDPTHVGKAVQVYVFANKNGPWGQAVMSGDRALFMYYLWSKYQSEINNPVSQQWWDDVFPVLFNHEIAHNMSLHHTVRNGIGGCASVTDHCDDTPSRSVLMSSTGIDPCCPAPSPTCSNNFMDDGSGTYAITPDQLGRIHYTLDDINDMKKYRRCYLDVVKKNLCEVGYPERSHFAQSIEVGTNCGAIPVVNRKAELYFSSTPGNETLITCIEVPMGATLDVVPVDPCN